MRCAYARYHPADAGIAALQSDLLRPARHSGLALLSARPDDMGLVGAVGSAPGIRGDDLGHAR